MKELDEQFQAIWAKREYINIAEALFDLATENKYDVSATIHSWNDWRAVENYKATKSADPRLAVG